MNEDQRVELLMRPRVIVENKWPRCLYNVGDILIKDGNYYWAIGSTAWDYRVDKCDVEPYPYLMRPLPWYAERTNEEMPKYVKRNDGSEVFERVFRYEGGGSIMVKFPKGIYGKGTVGPIGLLNVLPATSTQYNEYLKQKV